MIDLHSHIIPGLDDGVRSLDEACALASAAAEDGIRLIAATPHVRHDYPTTPEQMERGVSDVRAALAGRGIAVQICTGGEVALDFLRELDDGDLRRFTYAQDGCYLLVEFPYYGWPLALEREVVRLRAAGITAVVAHPERNPEVQERPDSLAAVVRAGAVVQLTAASLDGRLGGRVKKAARALVRAELAHVIASDAHAPDIRATGLSGAARSLKDERLARYMTEDAPAAIAAGRTLPPRP